MAKIILEPNETFEHYHGEESFTVLLDGEATYTIDDIEKVLEINQPVTIPAGKSHIMKNNSNSICILGCTSHSKS